MDHPPGDAPRPNAALPRSIVRCLPFLWSQVLFPGPPVAAGPVRRSALLILLVLPALLLYPCLAFHLFEPDEGRYAEIPREMLARGEWVVPYLQGEPYLDKPPLQYWLVMASYRLLGVHDWSARLVPALAVHGCILLTYLLGRRRLGERAAFWGALALALAPGFVTVGRLLVLDGVLALWVTLGLLAVLEAVTGPELRRGWWLLAAAATGLGVLTKGPVAVLLVAVPLVLHRWLAGRTCALGWRAVLAFAGVVLAVNLPWYTAVCLRVPQFAGYFFWTHNVVRFLTPFDHQHPVWFYGPVLAVGLLPASLLGYALVRFLASGEPGDARRRSPALGYMGLSAGWCILFFSLSGCKLPTYVLPAFPPLALAFGTYFAGSRWERSPWARRTVGAAVAVLAVVHYVAVPAYARFHSPMSLPEVVRGYCSDRAVPVVCYPRGCDSVSFYLGRDDLRSFRSKETGRLIEFLHRQPRTVVLFTHRHSPASLEHALPPGFRLTGLTRISKNWADMTRIDYCYMGVVER